jgi:hypothetical protein
MHKSNQRQTKRKKDRQGAFQNTLLISDKPGAQAGGQEFSTKSTFYGAGETFAKNAQAAIDHMLKSGPVKQTAPVGGGEKISPLEILRIKAARICTKYSRYHTILGQLRQRCRKRALTEKECRLAISLYMGHVRPKLEGRFGTVTRQSVKMPGGG